MLKKNDVSIYLICVLVLIFIAFPWFVGEDSILTIHDNLDSNAGWYKMFKDNKLFFTLNSPTPSFNGMSTLYFLQINYSLVNFIFCTLPTYEAYMLNYFIAFFVGFFSMFFLLKKLKLNDTFVITVISLTFSLLPKYYGSAIGVSSIPILGIVVINIIKNDNLKLDFRYLLLFFFPFISNFFHVGIFIIGLWFLLFLVLSIKYKRIHLNLFLSLLVLILGYIFVDFKLFYQTLVIKEPLNRSIFLSESSSVFISFKNYFVNGFYHFSSLQRNIILPFTVLFLLSYVIHMFGFMPLRIREKFKKINKKNINFVFINFGFIILFCFIGALYNNHRVVSFINKILPPLAGFNWGRIWILNIPLWYMLFAFIVICFNVWFNKKWLGYALVVLQLVYVMITPVEYNDIIKTWKNQIIRKDGIENKFISYREFFDVKLFDKIKSEIKYDGENVVAFGYHPSILMYNGFHQIDGYNNSYPLKYMRQFGALLSPEFVINHKMRDYYNSWGGRMYLYNGDFSFITPTRVINPNSTILRIDMKILKNDFSVKYILSRVKIINIKELGLDLVGNYTHSDSIYNMYVYLVK